MLRSSMIVDGEAERNFPAATSHTQEPAIVEGVEHRFEGMTRFGPVRTTRRRIFAESSDALADARRLQLSQEECQFAMTEMRQVCEAAQERESWWRRGVEAMEVDASERDYERDRLLDDSQREWSMKRAELHNAAAAATRQIQNQQSLIEAQNGPSTTG